MGIVCGNKSNVKKIYTWIHAQDKDTYRLAYFIDHDFDPSIDNADFFETETYAIENYYCTKSAFEHYLGYIGLTPVNDLDDYQRTLNFYQKKMSVFHSVVRLFNCYYAAVKKVERTPPYPEYDIKCGNNFKFAIVNIDSITPDADYTLAGLNARYGTNITFPDLEDQLKVLGVGPSKYYRGKYEHQMMKILMTP